MERGGGVGFGLHARTDEECEVGEPADDEGPKYSCQGHRSLVLSGDGRSGWRAREGGSGRADASHLKRSVGKLLKPTKRFPDLIFCQLMILKRLNFKSEYGSVNDLL